MRQTRRRHPRHLRRRSRLPRRAHAGDGRDHRRLRLQAGAGRQGLEPGGRRGAGRRRGDLHLQDRQDDFGAIALATWESEGIVAARRSRSADEPTGAAFIFVNDTTGDNAIIVVPGAAATIGAADVEAAADAIRAAAVFVTQLEQPVAAARRGLEIARAAGVVTVFNPAPAAPVDDAHLRALRLRDPERDRGGAPDRRCRSASIDDARRAGDVFLPKGAGAALITLGEAGALLHTGTQLDSTSRPSGPARWSRRPARATPSTAVSPRPSPAAWTARGRRPLRLRRRRHFGHPARHRALDADARRDRGAARRKASSAPSGLLTSARAVLA